MSRIPSISPRGSKLRCLKCGSTRIDDGSTLLFAILGVVLMIMGTCAWLCSFRGGNVQWTCFMPMDMEDPLGILVFLFGVSLFFGGLRRNERVRCLKCGTVWTPPKRRTTGNTARNAHYHYLD